MILYKVAFFVREGKEKQSRYESKVMGLTQPISTLPNHSHRTQSIMTFLRIYVYKVECYLFTPADKVLVIATIGAFTNITDSSVSLSSHEVV